MSRGDGPIGAAPGVSAEEPRRLRRAQEYLRPIVYGGNDGIVTTFAIVAGFAGAQAEGAAEIGVLAVFVFCMANLLADAVSMGLGEFLSGRSQRDLYRAEHGRELRRIEAGTAADRGGLQAILVERGLSEGDAAEAAAILHRSPRLAADLRLVYALNIPDPEGTSPAANGLTTFASFVGLGIVPLLPYFVLPPDPVAFRLSILATFGALAALGLLRWWATRENLMRSVAETVLVGGLCALVAYLVGAVIAGGLAG